MRVDNTELDGVLLLRPEPLPVSVISPRDVAAGSWAELRARLR